MHWFKPEILSNFFFPFHAKDQKPDRMKGICGVKAPKEFLPRLFAAILPDFFISKPRNYVASGSDFAQIEDKLDFSYGSFEQFGYLGGRQALAGQGDHFLLSGGMGLGLGV